MHIVISGVPKDGPDLEVNEYHTERYSGKSHFGRVAASDPAIPPGRLRGSAMIGEANHLPRYLWRRVLALVRNAAGAEDLAFARLCVALRCWLLRARKEGQPFAGSS